MRDGIYWYEQVATRKKPMADDCRDWTLNLGWDIQVTPKIPTDTHRLSRTWANGSARLTKGLTRRRVNRPRCPLRCRRRVHCPRLYWPSGGHGIYRRQSLRGATCGPLRPDKDATCPWVPTGRAAPQGGVEIRKHAFIKIPYGSSSVDSTVTRCSNASRCRDRVFL